MPGSEIFRQIDEAATRDDVLDVLAKPTLGVRAASLLATTRLR